MKYKRSQSAGEIAQSINDKFGYVSVATDDDLQVGEILPHLTSRTREDTTVQARVTGPSSYEEYAEQAEFVDYECTDCFAHYFRVELIPQP